MHDIIKTELSSLYGESVISEMNEIIKLYNIYDGAGQVWETANGLDYGPTKKITNFTKKLIKEESRFLFGKTPKFKVESENPDNSDEIQKYLDDYLTKNNFGTKLLKGAKDCFIGKRVALKTQYKNDEVTFTFRPSLEFVYQTKIDDVDEMEKIIFFYQLNDESEKIDQRIWKQIYQIIDGACVLTENVYNGDGDIVESIYNDFNTGLDYIPVKVIINDGLSGDLFGESDVKEIQDNQAQYNKLFSDDIDALKFNLFPQTVATDADAATLENLSISPGTLIDLMTDPTAGDNKQAKIEKLESSFNYNSKLENTLNRLKNDMYQLLNIPNLSTAELQGTITSAKAIKALYWQLITRCEEKFQEWKPALEWLANRVIENGISTGAIPNVEYKINVANIYPLLEDETENKLNDRAEVLSQTKSRKSYIEKWNENIDGDSELEQIQKERELLENSYMNPVI